MFVANAWKVEVMTLKVWEWEFEFMSFVGKANTYRSKVLLCWTCCIQDNSSAVRRRIFLVLFFAPNRLINLLTTHTEVQTVSLVPSISLPCFVAIPWMLWIFTQSWRDMPAFRNGRVDDNWLYKARHLECFILATSSSMLSAGWHWLQKCLQALHLSTLFVDVYFPLISASRV